MSHAISDIGSAVSNTVSGIGHAVANPSNLFGSAFGLGIGGAGGLMGGNLAGNVMTGQPIGTNMGGAMAGDLAGLALGGGIAGMMGPGSADPFAGFTVDPNTGDVIPVGGGAAGDPFAGYTVDPNTGDVIPGGGGGGVGAGGTASGGGLGGPGGLAGGTGSILNRLLGGAVSGTGGGNAISNFLTGQGGGASLPSLAPGLAALQYARQQTPVDTSQLQGVFNAAGANSPAFIQAAQHPLQQAQAGGYGDILQSQASRGIRGSSFGDQDIANYLTDTNRGIADAGTNAAQASLGLQGSLAGQISNLNALSQQMKNNLYGRAFSSLGQGLNPTPGGFGGQGGSMGSGGFMGGSPIGGGMLGNLGMGGVGNAFGNMLGNVGSGLGGIFGSPGSSIWSGPAQLPIQGMPTDFLGDMAGF